MYTIPMIKVGMARMKENSKRNKSRRLSCRSIARDRSSIDGGWDTLARKALSSDPMASVTVRIVMIGGRGLYVTLTIGFLNVGSSFTTKVSPRPANALRTF